MPTCKECGYIKVAEDDEECNRCGAKITGK